MSKILKNPTLSNSIIRNLSILNPKNYEEFLELLYNDIDFIIKKFAKSKDKYAQGMRDNSRNGEDLINTIVCDMLEMRGWMARHDTSVNGHADIVVELLGEDYQWIGEGKINRSNSNIYGGFKQLMYRYSTGLQDENAGGVLIYINQSSKSQLDVLNDWQKFLSNKNETVSDDNDEMPYVDVIDIVYDPKNPLVFYSNHKHPSSGLDYTIRHMVMDFRYQPKDR